MKTHLSFSPALWIIITSLLAGFALLMGRVVDVQGIRSQAFLAAAENNRFFTLPVEAARGVILDRYAQPLVRNQRTYQLLESATALYSVGTSLPAAEALPYLATDSARVKLDYQRSYPWREVVSHVVGYVGAVTAEDLLQNSTFKPYHEVGKYGLEKILDHRLRGSDGSVVYEIDARLNRQRIVEETPARPGENVSTSIDPYLSTVAFQALGNQRGSVVMIDTATGEVLTLVNNPAFDPELLSQRRLDENEERLRRQQVQALFNDEHKPFFDRAVSGEYPPGSVFKLVTALAGLESNAFDVTTTVVDEGVLKVGEFEYGNWYFRQFGRTEGEINLVRSIARSNDIFFYKAAEWIGPQKLADTARIFGLGSLTGIELGPEGNGLVPDPTWKEQTLKERWFLGNTYHFGIGQGDLLVTPIQMAKLVQALGHEGVACTPTVLKESEQECTSLGLKTENLEVVLRGMLDACSPGGTAFPFFERNGAIRTEANDAFGDLQKGAVACKTGTAEFGGADERGYRSTHGWFAAIVEPRVERGPDGAETDSGEGSEAAADKLDEVAVASQSAELAGAAEVTATDELKAEWQAKVKEVGFPQRIAIIVLVESDDDNPYKEGSRDAAPIAAQIIEWMEN